MAVKKNLMAKLFKLEGAVDRDYNAHDHVLSFPSPSLNFVFGKGWGLPFGYTLMMYGPPMGGKSLICSAAIAQLHKDYPDAVAVKFNTEMRETAQMTEEDLKFWGIDKNRYAAFDVNTPDLIFDRIEKEIAALIQEGLNVKLIIIDSMNAILGRRTMKQESVMTTNIGDQALTFKEGFRRISAVQKQNKIALILTNHIAAEMDTTEQMRGNKVKAAAAYGEMHYAEYFMYVEADRRSKAKLDLQGNALANDNLKDLNDRAEKTAHKVSFCMKDSNLGPKGRYGQMTFDYRKGIINTHEEIFLLGVNRGVIGRPNNRTYVVGDQQWSSRDAMIEAIRDNAVVGETILEELRRRDRDMSYVPPASTNNVTDEDEGGVGEEAEG